VIRNSVLAVVLPAAVIVSGLTPTSNALAGSKFDGPWSVAVYTTTGPCDPSYRFSGQIVNGDISYAYGSLEAHGRMTMTHGNGTWSGVGPDGHCAGTWQATRK
jgi:hypothetical protein